MGGRRLGELDFSRRDGVVIAAIVRGRRRLNIPGGDTVLFPGDILEVIGDDDGLQSFASRAGREVTMSNEGEGTLLLRRILIREGSPLIGRTLPESSIREDYRCSVVGFENDAGDITPARANHRIVRGDLMWVVGEDEALRELMSRKG